jgi:hypothetical protein
VFKTGLQIRICFILWRRVRIRIRIPIEVENRIRIQIHRRLAEVWRTHTKGPHSQGWIVYLPKDVVWLGWCLSKGAGIGNKRTGTDCLFTRRCSLAWQRLVEGSRKRGRIVYLTEDVVWLGWGLSKGAGKETNVQGRSVYLTEDVVWLGWGLLRAQEKGTNVQRRIVYLPEDVVWLGWGLSKGAGIGNKRTGTNCLFTRRCSLAWLRLVERRRKGKKRTGTDCLFTRICSLAWLRLVEGRRKREQTYRNGLCIYQKR